MLPEHIWCTDAPGARMGQPMAADLLLTAQRRDKPDVSIPDDGLIGQFRGFIDGVCLRADAGTTDISSVAFLAYNTSDQFKP